MNNYAEKSTEHGVSHDPVAVRMADATDYDQIYHFLVSEHNEDFARDTMIAAFRLADWPTHCWIALDGNKMVGIITTKNVSGCVYVSKNYRLRGIGSALMRARDEYINGLGVITKASIVDIDITNTGALALHSRHGYRMDKASLGVLEQAARSGMSLNELSSEPPTLLRLEKSY